MLTASKPQFTQNTQNAPLLFFEQDGALFSASRGENTQQGSMQQESRHHQGRQHVEFSAGVFPALKRLSDHGVRLVLVRWQDSTWSAEQVLSLLSSQGVKVDSTLTLPKSIKDQPSIDAYLSLFQPYLKAGFSSERPPWTVGSQDRLRGLSEALGWSWFNAENTCWQDIAHSVVDRPRRAQHQRGTKETRIEVGVDLDGQGQCQISTGVPFFDHMLDQIGKHAGFDLRILCQGDLEVDCHHTVEDVALALGHALRQALGDKRGIQRFAFLLPMDETLAHVALDLSARPYMVFEGDLEGKRIGGMDTEMVPHFFRSFAESLAATLHISLLRGSNTHHRIEACFKGLGRCLREAVKRDGGHGLPSTKGAL